MTVVPAGNGGHEVLGRGPAHWLDRTRRLELADHLELQRVQRRLQGLDLGDRVHQLGALTGRPQRLPQLGDLGPQR